MSQPQAGTSPSRLEAIPTLPVFFKLRGKRVLVAGGDVPAVWKTELLTAAGALVEIVAQRPCDELEALASSIGAPTVLLSRRPWSRSDLDSAALAIGAFTDDAEAERFMLAANAAGVPVNVIDKPEFCDFQFGTLIVRSPLVIAISTDGAAPVFGQVLRARIEALLPVNLRAWAEAAKAWRPAVRAREWSFGRRRRFWEAMADRALQADDVVPGENERKALFAAADRDAENLPTSVTFVGCGAGRPDDLTFAAARAMQNADVIVHDPDVGSDTVQLGRREAAKLLAPDDDSGVAAVMAQPPSGRRVVWLGTGNAVACPRWQRRRAALARSGRTLAETPGLARCPRCHGDCAPRGGGDGPGDGVWALPR